MRLLVVALLLVLPLAAVAQNPGRRVDAPFRFSPPDNRPSGLDAEKGRSYRDGLRNQLRVEEQRDIGRSALGMERLQETRRELDRMNGVLQNEPGARPPPMAREFPVPGEAVQGGGSRHQPTPAEIAEREADLARRDESRRAAGIDLNPVYDLMGERLQ